LNATRNSEAIRIGLATDEPIRVAGLVSIFDQPAQQGQAQLVPVIGSLPELLSLVSIGYVVIDLQSFPDGLEALEMVRHARPDVRLIVIGPEGDDELILNSIIAGARAYLGLSAAPEVIHKAIEEVTSGSIWAPRRLLSRLIDQLLKVSRAAPAAAGPQLTHREQQVLELLLRAHSTREIASQLGIEQRTVKAYIARLMRKTGVDNRIKLSMSALNGSLLPRQEDRRSSSAAAARRRN
jgi:DNA-binding NarL/FixJ family response regulator